MLSELVRPSIDYIRRKRFRSGNFPSSLSNESDRLVHWCHGAPGVIHMLLMAHQVRAPPVCYGARAVSWLSPVRAGSFVTLVLV